MFGRRSRSPSCCEAPPRADERWDPDERDALRPVRAAAVARAAGGEAVSEHDAARSTSAARCRAASPCSRRAPGPARRTRSPALAARYVAEGIAARPAAARHVHAHGHRRAARPRARAARERRARALARAGGGARTRSTTLLADCAAPRRGRARRDRLVQALADFDAATIATTHGFCQEVLGGLGVAGDLEPDAECCRGRRRPARRGRRRPLRAPLHGGEDAPRLTRAEAWQIAHETIRNPGAPIEPRPRGRRRCRPCARGSRSGVRDELERASARCR